MSKIVRTELAKYLYATYLLWHGDKGHYGKALLPRSYATSEVALPCEFVFYDGLFALLVYKDNLKYKEISFGYSEVVASSIVSISTYRNDERDRSQIKIASITDLRSFEQILEENFALNSSKSTLDILKVCLADYGILEEVDQIVANIK